MGLIEDAPQASPGGLREVGGQAEFDICKCSIDNTVVLIGITCTKTTLWVGTPDTGILKRNGGLVGLLIPISVKYVKAYTSIKILPVLTGMRQCSHTHSEEDPRGL